MFSIKKTNLLFCLLVFLAITSAAQQKSGFVPDKELLQRIPGNFTAAAAQYKLLMKNLPPEKFPKTFFPKTGQYEFSNSGWWCSGFYPGTLLYLYEQTKDKVLYQEALRIMEVLKKEQFKPLPMP